MKNDCTIEIPLINKTNNGHAKQPGPARPVQVTEGRRPCDPELEEREHELMQEKLGLMSALQWNDDPRHLMISMSRYKFVAKMFSGLQRVAEVGCGDGWGTRIVRQEVNEVTGVDCNERLIQHDRARRVLRWPVNFGVHDMVADGPLSHRFQGIFALDVLEHVAAAQEKLFVVNIVDSLEPEGVCIIGTPSLESQIYTAPRNITRHVNCKTGAALKELMREFFANVFLFSMNDEVVHTGFSPMAHYLFALCCGPLA